MGEPLEPSGFYSWKTARPGQIAAPSHNNRPPPPVHVLVEGQIKAEMGAEILANGSPYERRQYMETQMFMETLLRRNP